ncbi:hypothetical protein BABINDRAFT_160826 [Babjeviella inositovora NRRL Y-12698]|uniref:Ribosomal RNA-processing protein 41 n=1 Tax=Babjeviella inositovora NRRL Y-12698 TaxID=984486 RepID=A0A1E3QU86_9ASCO|nr:uncharacterized protein BABINDRAFT_160826 [Babjeviella inositovora NRRL Y-12698]ODQ80562.1 hypothetical protein BABINDRAFT_160826 [Babjeviella inositovora NRRL Y-12698]
MSNIEFYSAEGLRMDGRRWNELRRFECRTNTHPSSSDGSSYVEQGNSKVICLVNGPMEPENRSQLSTQKATLEVNLNIASFSTTERKKRLKSEKRTQELITTLERTFEQAIVTKIYPRTLISINIHVLSQDGGLLASCTNAVTLALIDAGIAMYDYISAVSAGLFDTTPLLDLNALEENVMSTLTVGIVGKSEKLALLLLEDKVPLDRLESILAISIAGSHRIRDIMDKEVRRHGKVRLSKSSS